MEIFRLRKNEILYEGVNDAVYDTWRRIKGVGMTVYFNSLMETVNIRSDLVCFRIRGTVVHPKNTLDGFIRDIALVN